jgi:ActR/RegA family two-component response regulator
MNGWDAFKLMREMNPGIRGLLATGYLEPGQKSEILKSGISNILNKPYHIEEILRAVRETLDGTTDESTG